MIDLPIVEREDAQQSGENKDEIASLAERFRALFDGLDRAYGVFDVNSKRDDGKKTGKAETKRAPVTIELWERHLAGVQGIGIVPIKDDCTASFGAIDVDAYTDLDHAELARRVARFNLPLVICRSKSGGAHLYLFAVEPVVASEMIARLIEMRAMLGFGQVEIFPKQDKVLAARGDVGSWINAPYFNGTLGMRYAVKEDGDAMTPFEFLAKAASLRQTEEFFVTPLSQSCDDLPEGPPCLQHLVTIGFPDGTRNKGLFNLGVYLSKMDEDNWESRAHDFNLRFMQPPLPHAEVETVIKSVRKKKYSYTCKDAPIAQYCNRGLCQRRKHGIGQSSGLPIFGSMFVLTTDPEIYFWDVDGHRVELSVQELHSPRLMAVKLTTALRKIILLPGSQQWADVVNQSMAHIEVIPAPPESREEGTFAHYLKRFCTGRAQANELAEIKLGKPFTDGETGEIYMRLPDLMTYFKIQRYDISQSKVTKLLRDLGGRDRQERLKGEKERFWVLPPLFRDDTPEEYDVPAAILEPEPAHF